MLAGELAVLRSRKRMLARWPVHVIRQLIGALRETAFEDVSERPRRAAVDRRRFLEQVARLAEAAAVIARARDATEVAEIAACGGAHVTGHHALRHRTGAAANSANATEKHLAQLPRTGGFSGVCTEKMIVRHLLLLLAHQLVARGFPLVRSKRDFRLRDLRRRRSECVAQLEKLGGCAHAAPQEKILEAQQSEFHLLKSSPLLTQLLEQLTSALERRNRCGFADLLLDLRNQREHVGALLPKRRQCLLDGFGIELRPIAGTPRLVERRLLLCGRSRRFAESAFENPLCHRPGGFALEPLPVGADLGGPASDRFGSRDYGSDIRGALPYVPQPFAKLCEAPVGS
ncbi:MAG: hypothetical protein ACYCT1_18510 [Steroidobacteraceae bacterium]